MRCATREERSILHLPGARHVLISHGSSETDKVDAHESILGPLRLAWISHVQFFLSDDHGTQRPTLEAELLDTEIEPKLKEDAEVVKNKVRSERRSHKRLT